MTTADRRPTSPGRRAVRAAAVPLALVLLVLAAYPTHALSLDGGRFSRPRAPPNGGSSPKSTSSPLSTSSAVEGSKRRPPRTRPSPRRVFLAKGALTAATSAAALAASAASRKSSPTNAVSGDASSPPVLRPPGKKSTASDVLAYLRGTDRLAPYASSGGHAVVTGGNSGIGLETVAALASAGMRVTLCCRRTEAGRAARESLPESVRDRVRVAKLDLADMRSVESAASEMARSCGERGLDVIVNNAGVADKSGPPRYTAQGLELQWGTNHVGHHLLTRLLLPSVNRGGRVVTVSSKAHFFAADTTEWGTGSDGGYYSSPYCQSKLCNVLFAMGLQDRLNLEGRGDVKSVSLHPGVISTPLFDGSTPVWKFIEMTADKTAEQGAATSTLCALADEVEGGAFYDDCRINRMSDLAKDVGGRRRDSLWARTEEVIKENGIKLPALLM